MSEEIQPMTEAEARLILNSSQWSLMRKDKLMSAMALFAAEVDRLRDKDKFDETI